MAKKVVKAAYLALGGTDYSAQIKGVELQIDAPEVDVTNMGSGGWNETLQGIKSGSLRIDFIKDADLSGLDAAIWAAITGSSGQLAFEVRLDSGAVAPANPKYTGTVSITQWMPVAGQVGAAFGGQVTWPTTGAITRATA